MVTSIITDEGRGWFGKATISVSRSMKNAKGDRAMIIDNAVKTAVNLTDKVGSRTSMILLSVLLPGFLIVSEVSSYYYLRTFGAHSNPLTDAANAITHNYLFALFLLFFVLAVSFAAGFLSRAFAFWISDSLLKRQRFGRTIDGIRFKYGEEKVNGILEAYPIFLLTDKEEKLKDHSKHRSDFYIRNYCKLWLKTRVITLAIESIEVEINIFLSLVIPLAGIVLPYTGLYYANLISEQVWIPVASTVAAILMILKINDLRRYETEQALVHFLFAHWEQLVTAGVPIRNGADPLCMPARSQRGLLRFFALRKLFRPESERVGTPLLDQSPRGGRDG